MKPDESAINQAINSLTPYQMRVEDVPNAAGELWTICEANGSIVYLAASSSELIAYAAGVKRGERGMIEATRR